MGLVLVLEIPTPGGLGIEDDAARIVIAARNRPYRTVFPVRQGLIKGLVEHISSSSLIVGTLLYKSTTLSAGFGGM